VARGNGTDEEDTGRTAWAAITLAEEERLVVVRDVEPPKTPKTKFEFSSQLSSSP